MMWMQTLMTMLIICPCALHNDEMLVPILFASITWVRPVGERDGHFHSFGLSVLDDDGVGFDALPKSRHRRTVSVLILW